MKIKKLNEDVNRQTVDIEYDDLEVVFPGKQRDVDVFDKDKERTIQYSYTTDYNGVCEILAEFITAEDESWYDKEEDELWKYIDDNFDTLFEKHEDKIKDNYRDAAAAEAAERINVDEYDYDQIDWDMMPGGHDYYESVSNASCNVFGAKGKKLDEALQDFRFYVSCNDGPSKVIRTVAENEDKAIAYVKNMYAQEHTTYADDRQNKWSIQNMDSGNIIETMNESEEVSDITQYRDELQKYLDAKTRPNNFFVNATFDNRLCVEITWGDWKHEHMACDWLVKEFFKSKGIEIDVDVEETDSDGGDAYSATHYYDLERPFELNLINESTTGNHFQVGDVIEYSSLYGGSITLTVEKVQGTKMWVDKSWVAEDTGETVHAKDYYFIQKDEEGNDCIIAWSYAGEQGLVYPPSTNREVEDNTVDKEAEIAELAKEMYDKGVECCSYDEFRRFMLDNNDTPTRELYKIYDDTIMAIAKSEEMQEAVEHVPVRNETIDRCLPIIKGTIHKAIREYDDTGILFDLGSNMHVIKNNAERVLKEIRVLKDSQNNTNIHESFNDNWNQRFAGMNVFRNGDYQIKSVILSSGEDGWELGTWNNGKYRRIDVYKDIDKAKKKAYDLKYPLGESIQEDAYTAQRYLDSELPDMLDHIISLIPNLRAVEIRNIISASRKFYALLEGIAARHSDVVKESLDESLFEDVEVETKAGPEEGPEFGLSSLLNQAIQDEFKTIDMYNSLAVTAKEEGFEDIVAVIDEINTEENKHVGQLQEILKTVSPNAEAIDAGEIEGAEQIVDESINNSNSSPNNINEGDADMTDRAKEIYNSFKEIEKELNGDGEAITAVIDKLYDDNREDPDYKIAYTKWADGE